MVAPPGALRWATRSASFVIPGCFGAVVFEFLRLVAFAARDPDFFLDDLMVMVFSSDIAAQIGAATGASPGWPGVVALTLLCAGKSSALARLGDLARLERKRKGKKLSNTDWVSKSDPEAKIAKMKDGTTHLAYKPEHGARRSSISR